MADVMIAALDGAARFDLEQLGGAAARVWPRAVPSPYTGQLTDASPGQLELESADGRVLFVVLLDDSGLGIEGDDALAAEFIAWLAAERSFHDDGRVVLTDWANEIIPVAAGITAEELLTRRTA